MKLEQLADLLGKDATELSRTFNLEDGHTEVDDEQAVKTLKGYLKELEVTKKKEGEGMARRLVSKELENKLKGIGAEGETFDDMVSSISEKMSKPATMDDSKYKGQIEAWKIKATTLEKELETERGKVSKIELTNKIERELDPILKKFEFGTDKVKRLAFNEFVNSHKFIDGGDMHLVEIDGKPTMLDKVAETFFTEFGKPIQTQQTQAKPSFPNPGQAPKGAGDLNSLMDSYRSARTATEKAQIMEQIRALEIAE